ncbi:hypothetical protein [Amycolatopsis sp. BJA-103]|uniref:hypothetical protein n=1 Tax=Amycolatopsis sp. BJA-103 TaxID=1911175 RepID=UPI000C78585C|nr:hypothetical protein [Amycolatopsis sp. BJA-103]AUI58182.1 hypothetical protein BKN51_08060 [Amycolatopsis sp. BJA-103]PNE13186.1 hypothetical protein B1H26_41765 [Amycolatopsis sp. BJA-103]
MAGIFIALRPGDGQDRIQGLDRSLGHVFGKDRILRSGGSASVLVVPIGAEGLNGLDDEVRREIAEALRLGKKIVPVLTEDAVIPGESDLPSEIAALSSLRYRRLGPRMTEQDIAGLVTELIRVAPELGIDVVKGLEDLPEWLDSWRHETRPVLPGTLPVLGRDRAVERLCAWLDDGPSVLPVYAGSRTEAAAFVATALATHRPALRAVRVSSQEGWRHCRNLHAPFVAVVDGAAVEVGEGAPGEGHVVVVRGTPDRNGADLLVLPGIPRDEAAEAFAATGVPPADANIYADLARRSVGSLRRRIGVAGDLPKWANPLERDLAAPLLLIGRWSAGSRHDLEEIAAIAGRETDELSRFFARSETGGDPLLARSGDRVRLADPHDAWTLLHGRLSAQDLRRWHEEAVKVLAEKEPGRTWSAELRHGLARSAALLSSQGETTLSGGVTCADHAARFVRELLGRANDAADGVLWRSLTDVLPLLAEAAPHEFLGAVDQALTSDPSPLGGVSGGLTAALETVCWSDEALPMVASLIAELTRRGTDDQSLESLITLVQPWYPYLELPGGQRADLVKAIGRRTPETGWRLVLALLRGPRGHLLASPRRPQVRLEWTVPAPPAAVPEGPEFQDELVTSALAALDERPQRWGEFFEQRPELNTAQWDRVVEALTRVDVDRLSADERLRLWKRLTGLTAEHRHYAGADWALPEELLQWLESCAEMVEPAVNPGRHGVLFGRQPYLEDGDSLGPEAREAEIGRLRRDAVGGVLREHGVAGLSALAAESAQPRLVGVVAAEVAVDDIQEEALAELDREDWASGWVGAMALSQGEEWQQEVATELKGQDRLVDYLLAIPVEHALALLDSADDAVLESYWARVGPWPLPVGQESFFVTQLARRRPWDAVKALELGVFAAEPPSLTASLVEDVLLQASTDGVEPPDRKAVAGVGPLLDHLVEAGGSDVAVARLELRYHPALKHHRKPRVLQRILAENPGAFVDLYTRIHPVDDGTTSVELVNAWLAIFETRAMPGDTGSGLDGAALKAWVSRARAEFAERGRAESGDRAIGTVLASGSPLPDDGWPPEPVRDVLDVADGAHLREGFVIGLTVLDGDSRDLVQRHRGWARRINVGWPRVAALLREHADDLARRG